MPLFGSRNQQVQTKPFRSVRLKFEMHIPLTWRFEETRQLLTSSDDDEDCYEEFEAPDPGHYPIEATFSRSDYGHSAYKTATICVDVRIPSYAAHYAKIEEMRVGLRKVYWFTGYDEEEQPETNEFYFFEENGSVINIELEYEGKPDGRHRQTVQEIIRSFKVFLR